MERATDLLQFLEKQAYGAKAGDSSSPGVRDIGQSSLMSYFAAASMVKEENDQLTNNHLESKLVEFLEQLEIDEMSPKEAMNALYEAKNILGGM